MWKTKGVSKESLLDLGRAIKDKAESEEEFGGLSKIKGTSLGLFLCLVHNHSTLISAAFRRLRQQLVRGSCNVGAYQTS